MKISGYFSRTFASSRYSSSLYTVPLGLLGELIITSLVLSVIEFSNCLGVILKSLEISDLISIEFPSARVTIAE